MNLVTIENTGKKNSRNINLVFLEQLQNSPDNRGLDANINLI